jgi:hypothetical protein
VLAAGAAAEVLPCEKDDRTLVLRFVQDELGVLAPLGEEELAEACALDALEGVARHDLVGVYVVPPERQGLAGDALYGLH